MIGGTSSLSIQQTPRSRLIAPRGASAMQLRTSALARQLMARGGVPGAAGSGSEPDVPALTIIFENRLI